MSADDHVEILIEPRVRPVGRGEVRRLLPHRRRRMVGPFIFADLIGPDHLPAGVGIDVDAHPHIGLSTLTYLFHGALVHRDSTGAVRCIEAGAVNWMTAGRGVTHTERSPDDLRGPPSDLAGLQTWVALPDDAEDAAADFQHVDVLEVPERVEDGVSARVVAGTAWGLASPVRVSSPLVLADVQLAGGAIALPREHPQLAVLAVDGDLRVGGSPLPPAHLAVLLEGESGAVIEGTGHAMVLGGAPVGPRLIWWNFVASSEERLHDARERWRDQRFPLVPGDAEPWVPLPE